MIRSLCCRWKSFLNQDNQLRNLPESEYILHTWDGPDDPENPYEPTLNLYVASIDNSNQIQLEPEIQMGYNCHHLFYVRNGALLLSTFLTH